MSDLTAWCSQLNSTGSDVSAQLGRKLAVSDAASESAHGQSSLGKVSEHSQNGIDPPQTMPCPLPDQSRGAEQIGVGGAHSAPRRERRTHRPVSVPRRGEAAGRPARAKQVEDRGSQAAVVSEVVTKHLIPRGGGCSVGVRRHALAPGVESRCHLPRRLMVHAKSRTGVADEPTGSDIAAWVEVLEGSSALHA